MILAQLKAHLAERGPAVLAGLAARFEVEPAALRAMLAQLMRRGLVRRTAAGQACGSCTSCDAHRQELFEWAAPPPSAPSCARLGPDLDESDPAAMLRDAACGGPSSFDKLRMRGNPCNKQPPHAEPPHPELVEGRSMRSV